MKLVDPAPWLLAALGLTSLAWNLLGPRPKRPSRPVRRATRAAFESLLRRLVVRAGWLLLRAPVRT